MKSKTVVFFNSTIEWGGGEKWHHDMALKMYSEGYKVVVFLNKKSALFQKLKDSGIKLVFVDVNNLSFINVFKLFKIKSLFELHKVYFLIINHPSDLKLAGLASKFSKVEHVIYRRGSAIPVRNSFSNKFIFKSLVTEIIANTEATKKTINQNTNLFPENKIKVIYNGICIDDFDKIQVSHIDKDNSKIVIGNIGRLVEQKAQYLLIELANKLKNNGLNFKVIIGGKGKLENELLLLREKYNLTQEVKFFGFVDNPKEFMSEIDVFVLTSQWEGFGYVLVEAMAFEKPVLAFDLSSNPEIIDDEKTGYLVPNNDLNYLADKIMFLSSNRKKMSELGKNGREKIEQKFAFKIAYSSFINYLISLG
ncbi:MAG: glycosyltransferase [Bacteroidales bacterium]|nr:glycosyltransferase [Bacteroidales bacterium]